MKKHREIRKNHPRGVIEITVKILGKRRNLVGLKEMTGEMIRGMTEGMRGETKRELTREMTRGTIKEMKDLEEKEKNPQEETTQDTEKGTKRMIGETEAIGLGPETETDTGQEETTIRKKSRKTLSAPNQGSS